MLRSISQLSRYVPSAQTQAGAVSLNVWDKSAVIYAEVHKEVEALQIELSSVPGDQLPRPETVKAIHSLKALTRFDRLEYVEVRDLDTECRRIILERYIHQIRMSERLTPFNTFNELFENGQEGDEEQNELLSGLYKKAVKALFTHPSFEQSLLERIEGKIAILGIGASQQVNCARKKIRAFSQQFDDHRICNLHLCQNLPLVAKMRELEAILFFQEQTQIMNAGHCKPTEELAGFIEYWRGNLNGLPECELSGKIVLIQAVEQCASAHAQLLSRLREAHLIAS